eukprot:5329026-Ditylum_brightwellii.AAC.1
MYDEVLDCLGFKPAWKSIDDDEKVMLWLLLHNKLHLNQAWETPCTRGLIKEYIGNYSLGVGAQDILEGDFDPNLAENLQALNQRLKHHIRQVAALVSIRVDLMLVDYKELIKSQDESTSSSPLGRHYGRYRTALSHD